MMGIEIIIFISIGICGAITATIVQKNIKNKKIEDKNKKTLSVNLDQLKVSETEVVPGFRLDPEKVRRRKILEKLKSFGCDNGQVIFQIDEILQNEKLDNASKDIINDVLKSIEDVLAYLDDIAEKMRSLERDKKLLEEDKKSKEDLIKRANGHGDIISRNKALIENIEESIKTANKVWFSISIEKGKREESLVNFVKELNDLYKRAKLSIEDSESAESLREIQNGLINSMNNIKESVQSSPSAHSDGSIIEERKKARNIGA